MKKILLCTALCSAISSENLYARTNSEDDIKYTLSFNTLALKPSGDFNYAAQANYVSPVDVTPPNTTSTWQIFDFNPHYAFGFELDFALYIPQLEASIVNSYEHFKSIQSNSISATSPVVIGAFFGVGQAQTSTLASTTFTFNLNEYNISYSQPIDCHSKRLNSNVSLGVSITGVKQSKNTQFSNTTATNIMVIDDPSEFIGAGLRLGTDFSYTIAHGLAFQGLITGALLTGNISNDQTFRITEPGIAADNLVIGEQALSNFKQSIIVADRLQVVPSFFERIGISYEFNKNNNWFARLEFGYQAQIYLNAIQSTDVSSQILIANLNHIQDQPPADGVSAQTFQRNTSNFALSGPYFKFNIEF